MGGIGSGRRHQGGKELTSNMLALDVRQLQRNGLLAPGINSSWYWVRNGKNIVPVQIWTEVDRVILYYGNQSSGKWQSTECAVYLEWTDCNLGGQRAWFLCPVPECGRRVAILYGSSIVACRCCHKLVYACQRENDDHRAMRSTDNIRQRLGWKVGIANPEGRKPKGMHWRTFKRMKARHDIFANKAWTGMAQRVMHMERQLARLGIYLDDLESDD